jgi:hypothetical protein
LDCGGWALTVEALVTASAGGLLCALALGAKAALADTRLPALVGGAGAEAEAPEWEIGEGTRPVDVSRVPLILTVARVRRGAADGPGPGSQAGAGGAALPAGRQRGGGGAQRRLALGRCGAWRGSGGRGRGWGRLSATSRRGADADGCPCCGPGPPCCLRRVSGGAPKRPARIALLGGHANDVDGRCGNSFSSRRTFASLYEIRRSRP